MDGRKNRGEVGMTSQVVIFGAGGHARVIASLASGSETLFVVGKASGPGELDEAAFFAAPERFGEARIFIGIGDNTVRAKIFGRVKQAGLTLANCIAPGAFVAADARLGEGVVICPGAAVMTGAVLGDNVIVNTLSSVDHDGRIGDHSQIAVGVTLSGGVTMGRSCFIGMKAGIFPGVSLGDRVIVRGGSLVTRSQPDDVMVGGTPARIVRHLAAPGSAGR
mgnify:CR=1 FL=1